jgi:hypothetical protein
MKRAALSLREENRILVKLFEESLRKKLDEIFKKESSNLYMNLARGLKKEISHLSPEDK